jgi:transcriptional regulator with XRE-family HTH domain
VYTTQSLTFGLLLKRHRRAAGLTQEELAQRMPDPHREAQARAVLGAPAARTGNKTEARDQLREALAIFQRLGAHPYIRRVQRPLARTH